MKAPAPVWEMVYRADRRKHRHRCKGCHKVVEPGQPVVMARTSTKVTVVAHADCADQSHGGSPITLREAMISWGQDYLRGCGWKVPA